MGNISLPARVSVLALVLTACTTTRAPPVLRPPLEIPSGPAASGGVYKVGEPYEIAGTWYYPREQPDYDETGIASWYGTEFNGRPTANGEVFDRNAITAAHPTLPIPVNARVTNLENGRSIVVRINDRGPFAKGRLIDLSERSADLLGFRQKGTARVRVTYLGRADAEGPGVALASDATPPEIASAMPAIRSSAVLSGELTPVAGASIAAALPVNGLPEAAAQAVAGGALPVAADGQVTRIQVPASTSIYVQAGAYASFENASRVATRLSSAGAQVSEVQIGGQPLYRVRIGPLDDVPAADAVLAQVQSLGQYDVGIVVE